MNPLFVGIDVNSKNNVTYQMKPDGSKHSSFSVQNNPGDAKLMLEKIVSALEAMSIYGDGLVCALREDGRLGRYQRKIHVLNPKQVRKFKEYLRHPVGMHTAKNLQSAGCRLFTQKLYFYHRSTPN